MVDGTAHRSSCGRSCLVRPVMAPGKTAAKPGAYLPCWEQHVSAVPVATVSAFSRQPRPTRQADRQICHNFQLFGIRSQASTYVLKALPTFQARPQSRPYRTGHCRVSCRYKNQLPQLQQRLQHRKTFEAPTTSEP